MNQKNILGIFGCKTLFLPADKHPQILPPPGQKLIKI